MKKVSLFNSKTKNDAIVAENLEHKKRLQKFRNQPFLFTQTARKLNFSKPVEDPKINLECNSEDALDTLKLASSSEDEDEILKPATNYEFLVDDIVNERFDRIYEGKVSNDDLEFLSRKKKPFSVAYNGPRFPNPPSRPLNPNRICKAAPRFDEGFRVKPHFLCCKRYAANRKDLYKLLAARRLRTIQKLRITRKDYKKRRDDLRTARLQIQSKENYIAELEYMNQSHLKELQRLDSWDSFLNDCKTYDIKEENEVLKKKVADLEKQLKDKSAMTDEVSDLVGKVKDISAFANGLRVSHTYGLKS